MRNKMLQMIVIIALRALAADADQTSAPQSISAPKPHADPSKATQLPGVTVQRRMDPLSRSDRHLARLKKTLPGDNVAPKQSGGKVHEYLAAHADPNRATGIQRQMMQGAQQAPPEEIPGAGAAAHP